MLFLFFVALTAFFNVAEITLVAARPARLDALSSRHRSNAALAVSLKQEPSAYLSAVQCGITATSILAGTFCVNAFITSALSAIPGAAPYASSAGTVIAALIATYLTLVFGELAPKHVALAAPERWAAMIGRPLQWTITLGRPFILLLARSNDLLLKALHVQEQADDSTTGEEIRSVILGSLRSGTIQAAERNMLESILQLRVRSARTIMTPRRLLEWVDVAMSGQEVKKRIAESPCSKLIVTQGHDVDHPLGVAAKKEMLRTHLSSGELNLEKLCQPPVFVAENSSILELLGSLKRARAQMLFVVDEFGP